jgi:uncharacterized repeat protein (TIGR01451 family)
MSSQFPSRRNIVSRIFGISALIAVFLAVGCNSGKGYGGGGGGGGTPSLFATAAGTGNFSSGQQGATYTITVRNSGTAATSGTVTVADPPTGFTITAMSGPSGSAWTCSVSTTTCTYSSYVTAGQSFPPITVTGNVTSANGTPVSIPLALSGGGAASVTVTPVPSVTVAAVALAITKSHTGNFTQGQTGTYTVQVSNGAGAGTTSGVVSMTDIPDTGLTVTGMSGTNWSCTVTTANSACTRSDPLGGGASYDSITVTVNVSATATSPQNNKAFVAGGNQVTVGVQATDSTNILVPPSLQISKSHIGNFTQGQIGAMYTLTVSNASGAGPTNGTVTVTDTLPSGLTATAITGTGWNCVLATLTCTRTDALAAGSSYAAITVTVNVLAAATSPQVNNASVSGGGSASANAPPDSTIITAAPVLSISKTHSGNFTQGQNGATYTVTVSNTGTLPTSGKVTVTDTVPTGLTLVSMVGTGWNCPGTGGANTCDRSDVLGAGSPAPSYPAITVTVNVAASAPTSVTNQVTASGGGTATAGNASDPTTINSSRPAGCPALLGNERLLNGTYIAQQNGWVDPSPVPSAPTVTHQAVLQVTAAFVTDGSGNIPSGEVDYGFVDSYSSPGFAQAGTFFDTFATGAMESCYNLGSDLRGLMIWNTSGGLTITYAFSVRADGTLGRFIEFDDSNPSSGNFGTRGAGFFHKQTGTPATPTGSLAFGTTGYSPNGSNTDYRREGAVGVINTATGVGSVNVAFATGSGGQMNVDIQFFNATFNAPDSLGVGGAAFNFTNFPGLCGTPPCPLKLLFDYYTIDATHLLLQSIDTPDNNGHAFQNGEAIAQAAGAFGNGSLNGIAVFSMTGGDLSSNHAFTSTAVGEVNGDGTGLSSAMIDEVSNGVQVNVGTALITGGSFSGSANGMSVLTIGATRSFSVAMYDQSAGFLLEGRAVSPGSNVLVGDMQPQTAPTGGFANGTFSGLYSFGSDQPASTDSTVDVGSGTAAPNTSPASFSGMSDESNGAFCSTNCLITDQTVSQTYSVDGNGRITVTHLIAGGMSVGWLFDNKNVVVIGSTSAQNGTIVKLHQ